MRCIPELKLRDILLLALILSILPSLAAAQVSTEADLDNSPDILAPGEPSAAEDAEDQEEEAAFAYLVPTGELAFSLDTAAVFCPDSGSILVHPNHTAEALTQFNARDLGNGTWEVPDPDTGNVIVAQARFASAVFDDGRGDENADELGSLASLKVVPVSQVVLARWFWPRCWRLRLHYRCGVVGSCPFEGQCRSGYYYSRRRNFLQCTYAPWNLCLEFLYPVCTVTRYTCRDCTGPIIFRRPLNRFVCAVF